MHVFAKLCYGCSLLHPCSTSPPPPPPMLHISFTSQLSDRVSRCCCIIMKLEIFLSFLLLAVLTLGGEAIVQDSKSALLHGDVTISYVPTEKMDIASSTWKFDRNGEQITILTINGNSEYVYDSEFKGRLQKSEDSFTLTIRDLTMEDAGIYRIDFVQKNGKTISYSCNVTVYEPVPKPNIEKNDVRKTNDQCNFTLHCSVPSNISNLVYEWKYRDGNSAEYQPYHNGSTILSLSLLLDHQDMEILCVVRNPVNATSSFIQVQEICKFSGEKFKRATI
ncbi:hypothetical protein GDO81_022653 [Engystomops pustulosus]|uniref:Ig-like domain-containing protein n=1 Tax=Engystomops pustulosus TaxID=76066 RepID=A0AAV6Z4C0_ENGPU|nr:hypothetical protein GDO81_022653 [Engystomops pustulosus]